MRRTDLVASCLALALLSSPAAAEPARLVPAPTPTAPFSKAASVNGILYLSGEIGAGPDGKLADGFEAQARQTMDNIGMTLRSQGLGMEDVFKCSVFLADMSQWPAFNRVYVGYFKPGRLPARSALGASGLAAGAALEVECWAKER